MKEKTKQDIIKENRAMPERMSDIRDLLADKLNINWGKTPVGAFLDLHNELWAIYEYGVTQGLQIGKEIWKEDTESQTIPKIHKGQCIYSAIGVNGVWCKNNEQRGCIGWNKCNNYIGVNQEQVTA